MSDEDVLLPVFSETLKVLKYAPDQRDRARVQEDTICVFRICAGGCKQSMITQEGPAFEKIPAADKAKFVEKGGELRGLFYCIDCYPKEERKFSLQGSFPAH